MHKKHAGRAADRASAVAATADIVGEEHFTAAASVPLPIVGFDLECAGKYDEELTPRRRVPVLKLMPGKTVVSGPHRLHEEPGGKLPGN